MFKKYLVSLMVCCASVWAVDLSIENVDTDAGTLDIVMNNSEAVAGFQFNLTGVTITGASGGSAAENGFMMSTSATTIIGFSLTGSTIPPGSDVLVNVTFTDFDSEICFSSPVVSDPSGNALDVSTGDCYTEGGGGNAISFGSVSDGSLEVYLSNDTPVAGFQFNITGITITGASGGSAEAAGLMVSTSASTVI